MKKCNGMEMKRPIQWEGTPMLELSFENTLLAGDVDEQENESKQRQDYRGA